MARDIQTYEHLRDEVLRAQARPQGLAAVTYHGLLGGLKVIGAMGASVSASGAIPTPEAPAAPSATDPALVRMLTNMVLLYQQEVSHVF